MLFVIKLILVVKLLSIIILKYITLYFTLITKCYQSVIKNLKMEEVKTKQRDYFAEYAKKHGGFFKIFEKIKTIQVKDGNYLAELKVSEEHVNAAKILHGGLISALIDNFNCAALLSHKNCLGCVNATVAMRVSFLKPALLNDVIIIDARTVKTGRILGHVECEIRNKTSNEILSKGESTVVIIRSKL